MINNRYQLISIIIGGIKIKDPKTEKTYIIQGPEYYENCINGSRLYCKDIITGKIEIFSTSKVRQFEPLIKYKPAEAKPTMLVDKVEMLDTSEESENKDTTKQKRIEDEVRGEFKRRRKVLI